MKGAVKRSSADVGPQPAEGIKRRKRSRSAEPQPPAANDNAQAATDDTADAAAHDSSPKARLVELFRDEDVAQLASDYPLEAAVAIAHRTRSASLHREGGTTKRLGSARRECSLLPGRPGGAAVLTEEELLSQRCRALGQLYRLYKREYWALMEELRTRHQQFCAVGGSALRSPAAATAMADSDEELSVRDLFRRWEHAAGRKLDSSVSKAPAKADGNQPKGQLRRRKHGRGEDSSAVVAAADAATAGASVDEDVLNEGSDQECPGLSDVEEVILQQDPYGPASDTSALLRGYGGFRTRLPRLARLEECASAAFGRDMDVRAALAALLGPTSRFLIHRTTVILGRGGPTNVDVDVSLEGDARKVSRRAASIVLHADGAFSLRCLGRRLVRVNGREVLPGSSAPLPHLSLLEAGRVRLLFAVNPGAVHRIVRRSRAITLEA